MSKLSAIEKEMFEMNAEIFGDDNVFVVSIKELGLTIGLQYTNWRMKSHVRVYVAQCSQNDKFKFKRGVNELMNKYGNDNYIVVPTLGRSISDILDVIIYMYYEDVGINDVACRCL
jgi:hypothetical protein